MSWSVDEIQQRWHSAISVFAHIFLAEGPGSERSNFLNAKAGFASRMARYVYLQLIACTVKTHGLHFRGVRRNTF